MAPINNEFYRGPSLRLLWTWEPNTITHKTYRILLEGFKSLALKGEGVLSQHY
jgi:hypothetical protein